MISVRIQKGYFMKEIYISDLKTGMEFMDFFMVKSIELKVGSNKKQYLDLTLGDSSGEINGKKWDVSDEEARGLEAIGKGDLVKIKANVTEWVGSKQLRILKIRKSAEEDQLSIMDYVKAAPEDSEDMWKFIHDRANGIRDSQLRAISLRLLKDNKEKLLYWPAASRNHHAEYGGLLYHMKRMLMNGEFMCQVYRNLNPDLLKTGVIIHDIEKINEIESDELGISPGYSFEGQLLGHIIQGVKTIEKIADEIGMDNEKKVMLQHMVVSHHYEPEFGSPKKPMFPEAEILHYLDIIDARMFDMEDVLACVDPGTFSEKVWVLDNRRLYKPSDKEEGQQ